MCENIFQDLNNLAKTRTKFVHENDYVDEWTKLRSRVDFVMCELQKISLEAHDQTLQSLNDWFKEVVSHMKEVEIKRDQEKSKFYLSDTPFYLDTSGIISSAVHSKNHDLTWLTKLKIQAETPILAKLKTDSEQEERIKQLEKDLFEQRLMYVELQRKMISQQEEAKIREEALVKSHSDLKESMEKQYSMMQEMMELMKKQAKP